MAKYWKTLIQDYMYLQGSSGCLVSGSLLVNFQSMLQAGWESSDKRWDGVNIFSFYIVKESCNCLCLERKLMS